MTDQEQFCARLKGCRETKGLSVRDISATTKISAAFFEGLEANDLSRWPKGIYRRAYLREYLATIGLPMEPSMGEFRQLFPDEDDTAAALATAEATADAVARATPTQVRPDAPGGPRQRVLAALLDAGVIVALGALAAMLTDGPLWTGGMIAVVCYHVGSTAWSGRSVGGWWLTHPWWTDPAPLRTPLQLRSSFRGLVDAGRTMSAGRPRRPDPLPEPRWETTDQRDSIGRGREMGRGTAAGTTTRRRGSPRRIVRIRIVR